MRVLIEMRKKTGIDSCTFEVSLDNLEASRVKLSRDLLSGLRYLLSTANVDGVRYDFHVSEVFKTINSDACVIIDQLSRSKINFEIPEGILTSSRLSRFKRGHEIFFNYTIRVERVVD